MKLEHSLTPYTKIKSKWIKDRNVSPDIIQLLEVNIKHSLREITARSFLTCLLRKGNKNKKIMGPNEI